MNEQEKNVVEYLTEHPDFFTTQPELLAKLSVIHPDAARDNLTIISAINQIKYFTHTETKLQKVW